MKDLVLAIESTCDDTAVAIMTLSGQVVSHKLYSQNIHEQFGGVFPELASRLHAEKILILIHESLKESNAQLSQIKVVCVAYTPGMIGSLLVGTTAAKTICCSMHIPLICVNHIEAHLYAAIRCNGLNNVNNCIGYILSGGHTELLSMSRVGEYKLLGKTLDDAVGEAFDKVASMLGLTYPGGNKIEELAKNGNNRAFKFKVGSNKKNIFDISLSGLKTSIFYLINSLETLSDEIKQDIAASFQYAVFSSIIDKINTAIKNIKPERIVLGGGVTINSCFRNMIDKQVSQHHNTPVLFPDKHLCTDNAIMIGWLGLFIYNSGITHELTTKPEPIFQKSTTPLYST